MSDIKKKYMIQLEFWFPNVCKKLLCQIEGNCFGNWAEIKFVQIQMCLFKVSLSHHCQYTVRMDQCSNIDVSFGALLKEVNHICTSFFCEAAVLSHRLCKEINRWVVFMHKCVERDRESHVWLVVNAADIKAFPTEHCSFKNMLLCCECI